MKKFFSIVIIFCAINIPYVEAQTSKGKILVGASTSIGMAGSGSDLMTLGYSIIRVKNDVIGTNKPNPDEYLSLNISPRAGYFIIDNLALGLDINFASTMNKNGENMIKQSRLMYTVGPFMRYYIPANKVIPFVEVNGSVGGINYKYRNLNHRIDEKSSVTLIGGGFGIAVPLSERVTFDVLAGYNSYTEKEKEDNPENFRTQVGTVGFKFGFNVFLGPNLKHSSID